jgi:hypothetical protein
MCKRLTLSDKARSSNYISMFRIRSGDPYVDPIHLFQHLTSLPPLPSARQWKPSTGELGQSAEGAHAAAQCMHIMITRRMYGSTAQLACTTPHTEARVRRLRKARRVQAGSCGQRWSRQRLSSRSIRIGRTAQQQHAEGACVAAAGVDVGLSVAPLPG